MLIQYHLDEHVHPGIALGLQSRGIDVTTTASAMLIGASDEKQLAFASNQQRVVVTHDRDFLRLNNAGVAHVGIVYCHQTKYSVGSLLQTLLLLQECESRESMVQRVEYL